MFSLCFSIWGVSSLLSLPVPISLDYTKLKAFKQAKGNFLKSSKSKGDSHGYSHTLSGAYQTCCLCLLQKHCSDSQATLRTSNKYKDFSNETSSFAKAHVGHQHDCCNKVERKRLRPLQVTPELSGHLHFQYTSSFHSQDQLTCLAEKLTKVSQKQVLRFGCSRQQKHHAAAPPPARVRRRMERNRQKLVGRDKDSLTEQQTKRTGTTIQIRKKHNTNCTTQRAVLPDWRRVLPSREIVPAAPASPHRNPAWRHRVWNTLLSLTRWGQPTQCAPFLDSGEN